MPRFEATDVRDYYDRQTAGFVALGQGGSAGALHRAVWGPGVTRREDAFHYVEDAVARALGLVASGTGSADDGSAGAGAAVGVGAATGASGAGGTSDGEARAAPLHLLDLGCGIGGSLCHLAARYGVRGTGITLSPVQARLAARRIEALGLSDRVTCLEGDFTALPPEVGSVDAAFAIESFVHGPAPERFFAECARVVRPGGALFLCDDVRRATSDPRAGNAVEQFTRGWRVNSLLEATELRALASAAGFTHVETTDLTPWLELGRPRDRAIALFVALFGWLPLARTPIAHVVGGSALQTCLRRGWVGYELVRWRRT